LDKKLLLLLPLIGVVLITQYLLMAELTEEEDSKLVDSFRLGYDRGISDSINRIINETKNCSTSNIFSNNSTVTLIDINCLP
jgi:hypothetical protein